MKKLTILTSLSYLMGTAFKDILLNPDKYDRYIKIYTDDFKRRLTMIKNKYEWYCFDHVEVISFFSPIYRIREEQLNIEKEIVKLIDFYPCCLNVDDESDVIQNYMTYINSGVKSTLMVLDVTDITKGDIIDLVHAIPFNQHNFYVKFYSDE